jgi:hypothetical protein
MLAGYFDKIVDRRCGGWCYEMNGTFTWLRDTTHLDVRDGVLHKRHITDLDDYRVILERCLGSELGGEADQLWAVASARAADRGHDEKGDVTRSRCTGRAGGAS